MAALAVVVVSFLYTLPATTALTDDHFMHVASGRQILKGRLPLRDKVTLGMPLQSMLSAAVEQVVGYRLLSEALIISSAFAAGALLIFALARRAANSVWIGMLAAAVQVAASPRTYSYPKVLIYAAGIALLWRYVDRPSRGRASAVAAAVVVAFYLRHDHGLYLGLVAAAVLILRHAREWRLGLRRLALVGTLCCAAVAPYALYVQTYLGIDTYLGDIRGLATREYQQNHFERWPQWPLASLDSLVGWTPRDRVSAIVGVRWNPAAAESVRREAADRYRLELPGDGQVTSGRFRLDDVTPANALALVRDPAIDDTAGIDRRTGTVDVPGIRLGALHLLPGLDAPSASAALLFYLIAGCVVVTIIWLRPGRAMEGPAEALERIKIATVVLVAMVTAVGLLREPLAMRIADALVAPLVLAAWWAGRLLRLRWSWRDVSRASSAALIIALLTRSVAVVGQASSLVRDADDWLAIPHQLWVSPPFDAWPATGTAKYRAVRYVRECTRQDDPLLVLWFAPDLYYYADRPFAGRLGFYMEGYWASPAHERRNLAAVERDRPVLAIVEAGREATDLYTYPRMLQYVDRYYHQIGVLTSSDGHALRVLARNDRSPQSIDPELGWPCFR